MRVVSMNYIPVVLCGLPMPVPTVKHRRYTSVPCNVSCDILHGPVKVNGRSITWKCIRPKPRVLHGRPPCYGRLRVIAAVTTRFTYCDFAAAGIDVAACERVSYLWEICNDPLFKHVHLHSSFLPDAYRCIQGVPKLMHGFCTWLY